MGMYSSVFDTSYTHYNGNTYQQWSSIDNLKSNGQSETLNYYQDLEVVTRNKEESLVFWDNNLDQETATLESDQVVCLV